MSDASTMIATPESVSALSGAPLPFKLAARAALRFRVGSLLVTLPDGRKLRFQGEEPGAEGHMILRNWRLGRRILASGALGFAESYIAGDWDSDDLAQTLAVWSQNLDGARAELAGDKLVRAWHRLQHLLRRNTPAGSKRNILAHYDLGNDFYRLWLDDTMTYSSALFEEPGDSLERAQDAKYRSMADQLELNERHSVLEIGCGWGGFAEYAARERGARVTGVTISPAQYDYAKKRIFEKQLAHKVDIQLMDYREVEGRFDKVASIEMFEAVGERYWSTFFEKMVECLKPGGGASLQVITVREDLFKSYRRQVDFIQRHIFPGGMLPSVSRLRGEATSAGLTWRGARMFGGDYAGTLRAWGERFQAAWSDVRALNAGFDDRFQRLWRYYLAYCEAGFDTGRIDVGQFTLTKA